MRRLADTNKDNPERKVRLSSWARCRLPRRAKRIVTHARNARILINARFFPMSGFIAGAGEAKRGSVRRGTQAGGACD
ncbi:hypothetical protein GCM10010270_68680 [Streptomyces violaceus]|nr:hypothetical protein GCM10010270_68680 [Streptomyces janthinus]